MTPAIHSAQVRAYDRVMYYRRSGTGPALLVLAADPPGDFWPELTELLADHFKVIVPELPPGQDPEWLRCLLEGLGAAGISVVAGGDHCETALALALVPGEYVSRLVLLTSPDSSPASQPAGSSAASLRGHGVRLYVLPARLDAPEAAARIAKFLGDP